VVFWNMALKLAPVNAGFGRSTRPPAAGWATGWVNTPPLSRPVPAAGMGPLTVNDATSCAVLGVCTTALLVNDTLRRSVVSLLRSYSL
jgi:hypothetical protein